MTSDFLEIRKGLKIDISRILEALIFQCFEFLLFSSAENYKITNSKSPETVKMTVFGTTTKPKLISH